MTESYPDERRALPKEIRTQCEGMSSKPHPHAFGHRVSGRCESKARWKVGRSFFCGRCVKHQRRWSPL